MKQKPPIRPSVTDEQKKEMNESPGLNHREIVWNPSAIHPFDADEFEKNPDTGTLVELILALPKQHSRAALTEFLLGLSKEQEMALQDLLLQRMIQWVKENGYNPFRN